MKVMHILVVDDSHSIRSFVAKLIAEMGHEAAQAENGQQALDYVKQHDVDLVLMDVEMPVMDGFTATKAIRDFQQENWFPIIFLTGKSDDESYAECINAGGDAYLPKPINPVRVTLQISAMERIYSMRKKLQKAQAELIKLNENLRYLSFFDQLTGLANRRNFDTTLDREFKLAQRDRTPLSLIMCDIDFFKAYNDHYGHLEGDRCISKVAKAIGGEMQSSSDLACRYGGEEFSLILPKNNLASARTLAENIRCAVQKIQIPHQGSKVSEHVSLSLGVATYTGQFKSLDELVRAADDALYQAKKNGRNQVGMA